MRLHERIQALRKARKLTQRALAQASGVSPAALSQIEAGLTSPSVATLEKLADGLGVSIAAFFLGREEDADVEIFALDARPAVPLRGGSRLIPLMPQRKRPDFEPLLLRLAPGGHLAEHPFGLSGGIEYVWVRKGRAVLEYEARRYEVAETQSIYYDPVKPHNWRNPFAQACELLMVRSR